MKKLISIVLIGLLTFGNAWAGSISTGAIDTVARANAATAQATANAAEPTASLPAYLASPPPIGGTTPAAGTFTSITNSGFYTQTGTATNTFTGVTNISNVAITGGTIGASVTGGAGFGKPGWVFDFAGTTCPAGTLNVGTTATTVSRTTYANLFAAIGTTWGAGDGSTTFGIPSIPADYGVVQANANVGTRTVGSVISHTHSFSGSGSWPAYEGGSNLGETGISAGSGILELTQGVNVYGTVGSTGGSANLGAGVRFLKCIQY